MNDSLFNDYETGNVVLVFTDWIEKQKPTLKGLKKELEKQILLENYENCAKIRDEINSFNNN